MIRAVLPLADARRQAAHGSAPEREAGSPAVKAVFGRSLPGGPRGICPGAPANLLVLDPRHPALFPAVDLPRLLTCAAVGPAIYQLFVRGRAVGQEGHYREALLASPEYQQTLTEALARRKELLARLGTASPDHDRVH